MAQQKQLPIGILSGKCWNERRYNVSPRSRVLTIGALRDRERRRHCVGLG